MIRLALTVLLAIATAGCGGPLHLSVGAGTEGALLEPPPPPTLTLRTDWTTYAPGEPVSLTLTVRNLGATAVRITAPTSQLHEVVVWRAGREVWRWGADKVFLMALTEWTLAPGSARELAVTWDQRGPDGRPVGPGRYVAEAALAGGAAVGIFPARHTFEIR